MKGVRINAMATINRGIFKDIIGKVIAFDSEKDEVIIDVDIYAKVIIDSESIDQI
jgi:transcription antitermination factor NusG